MRQSKILPVSVNRDDPIWSVAMILYHQDGSHTLVCGWKQAATKDDAISMTAKEAARDVPWPWTSLTSKAIRIPAGALPHDE